jgi:glycosyltransferase involved in cell wall biosynthesis
MHHSPTLLIGHPFAQIGMGEHLRAMSRALAKAQVAHTIHDVYGLQQPALAESREFASRLTNRFDSPIRIFAINGDEVDLVSRTMNGRSDGSFSSGYNVIYPAWELPYYPEPWARELNKFDEVWAPSDFVRKSIESSVTRPVLHMPLAVEPRMNRLFERRYFGLPEHRVIVLLFFDALSFASRKNPWAVIDVFSRLIESHPLAQVQLVLKVNNADRDPKNFQRLVEITQPFDERVTLITSTMSDDEIKSLVRCCDVFLSLHRSEGFGRGLSEAMYFDRPVVGTGWSGNMDYMTPDVSRLVDYDLVPVGPGEYPFWEGQHWAEPNIATATVQLLSLIENPVERIKLGARAGAHMRKNFSYRTQGVRYLKRIDEIFTKLASPVSADLVCHSV